VTQDEDPTQRPVQATRNAVHGPFQELGTEWKSRAADGPGRAQGDSSDDADICSIMVGQAAPSISLVVIDSAKRGAPILRGGRPGALGTLTCQRRIPRAAKARRFRRAGSDLNERASARQRVCAVVGRNQVRATSRHDS
jgi:hypothetical protein